MILLLGSSNAPDLTVCGSMYFDPKTEMLFGLARVFCLGHPLLTPCQPLVCSLVFKNESGSNKKERLLVKTAFSLNGVKISYSAIRFSTIILRRLIKP
jgi:hypothetical protein